MSKWPKQLPPLSEEQVRIKDDFMKYWHEVLPKRYGLIERFNHGFPVKHAVGGGRVLEIGAGLGEHIAYEDLDTIHEYHALELRPEMAEEIRRRYPQVRVSVGDCEKRLSFPDGYFNRVLAVHVLEHLPNLPAALQEIHRVLSNTGQLEIVIPCEGGLAYSLARRISARRLFEKRYGMSYDWCIGSEHVNTPREIFEELESHFVIKERIFYPLRIPLISANLVIGAVLKPKH